MKQFNGTIAGKRLNDFNNFDNKLKKLNERIKFVEENISNEDGQLHDFFTTYTRDYYDVSPSQNGYLAEETAVFKMLENFGTYIINSKDVDSHRKVTYKFWVNEKEFNKYKESENVNESTLCNGDEKEAVVEVIHMFTDNKNKNSKIVKPVSINKQDIKDIEEVRLLELAIKYLQSNEGVRCVRERAESLLESELIADEDIGRIKYVASNTEDYINKYIKSLRENQVLIKRTVKKPIEFKSILKDEGVPNKLDAFDFMEKRHIKTLLPYLGRENMMTELGMIIYDVNKLLDEADLSNKEKELVKMFRDGLNKADATREMAVAGETTNKMMNRISLKAVKAYEKKLEKYREEKRLKKI